MSLFQKHPNQLPIELPIRLIPHRQIQPGLLVHNALIVGKSVKAVPAVVGAHAALAEASEAHLAGGQMDDGVVDAAASEAAARGDMPGHTFVGGKEIQGQRVGL